MTVHRSGVESVTFTPDGRSVITTGRDGKAYIYGDVVNDGATARDIGATLLSHTVVKSVRAFTNAANSDPRSRQIEPGFYQLRLHMSGRNALLLILMATCGGSPAW